VVHVNVLAAETGGGVVPVAAQANQVAVELDDAGEAGEPIPLDGVLVVEEAILQHLLTLEDHGDAGAGHDQARAKRGALLGVPAVGVAGPDLFGDARPAVGDLVVGFGVDDAGEGVAAVAVADGVAHGVHVAPLVVGADDDVADRVDERGGPLGVEASPAFGRRLGEPGVLLEVFGDADLPGLSGSDLVVDPLHQAPTLGVLSPGGVTDIGGRVPPEAICLKLFEPEQGVVADELAYSGSAVVSAGAAPRRCGAGE